MSSLLTLTLNCGSVFDEDAVWATKDAEEGTAALERSEAACSLMGGYLGRLLAEFEDRQTITHLLPKLLLQQGAEVAALSKQSQDVAAKLGTLGAVELTLKKTAEDIQQGKRPALDDYDNRSSKAARVDSPKAQNQWHSVAPQGRGQPAPQSDIDERMRRMRDFAENVAREQATTSSSGAWRDTHPPHHRDDYSMPSARGNFAKDSVHRVDRSDFARDGWAADRAPPGGPRGREFEIDVGPSYYDPPQQTAGTTHPDHFRSSLAQNTHASGQNGANTPPPSKPRGRLR